MVIKKSIIYDSKGRQVELIRKGKQLDSVRFIETSRKERYTGKINKSIKRFVR